MLEVVCGVGISAGGGKAGKRGDAVMSSEGDGLMQVLEDSWRAFGRPPRQSPFLIQCHKSIFVGGPGRKKWLRWSLRTNV